MMLCCVEGERPPEKEFALDESRADRSEGFDYT